MRILITGASGFIGGHLIRSATSKGFEVLGLSRSRHGNAASKCMLFWSFGHALPPAAKDGIDCAVHLAHDFGGEEGARRTVAGTLALAEELRQAGVSRQLFFSSFSAREHASSLYGRTKFELECRLGLTKDVVIVRPGLVVGNGGLYGRISKWARRLPVIPLPDGGRGEVPVVGVGSLCDKTLKLAAARSPPREANLCERQRKTLRALVLEAASEVGRSPWILPVPSTLLFHGLRLAEAMHLPLPVNADNLAGFLANQAAPHVARPDD